MAQVLPLLPLMAAQSSGQGADSGLDCAFSPKAKNLRLCGLSALGLEKCENHISLISFSRRGSKTEVGRRQRRTSLEVCWREATMLPCPSTQPACAPLDGIPQKWPASPSL